LGRVAAVTVDTIPRRAVVTLMFMAARSPVRT